MNKNDDPVQQDSAEGSFCFAPFVQMLLAPTGRVHPCCWHFGKSLGDVKTDELLAIWNGPSLQSLRREFLTGAVKTCRSRIMQIGCHRNFDRFAGTISCDEIMDRPPVRLDLRLNGQCNLQCVMCDVWQQPNGRYNEINFWELGPKEIFPYLKEVDLLGGEPLIQKDTYRLINAITAVNERCLFSFVTNGQLPFKTRIKTIFESISLREVQVSLDSLDSGTYAAIRKKGELETVLSFIADFSAFRTEQQARARDFVFKISMCVQESNWREVPRFLQFCANKNAQPELQFAYYDANSRVSLEHFSKAEKREVLAYLSSETPLKDHPFLRPIVVPLALAVMQTP